jgi:hypothetical protein
VSQTGQGVEAQIQSVADAIGKALPVIETVAAVLAPEAAGAVATAIAVAKGVIAMEPQALALWERFQSGTPPTQDELDAYAATEQAAYDQVTADIQAKLAE